jgi:DNA invertase Pin-like site-specific DNA recombinase
MSKQKIQAVAYLRTSSQANVGTDKDSDKRQRDAIKRYAKAAGYEIADGDWFYDPGVSGADPIETRDGFKSLLDRIDGNGVRTVLIDEPSRFARDLTTQELGIALMIGRDVKVLCANGDDLTVTDDPMRKAMRQIAGAFMELEKTRLVDKLRAARDRRSAAGGERIEGRKSIAETAPEATALAKRLAHGNRKQKMSLREIAAELERQGYVTKATKKYPSTRYSAKTIAAMLKS